MSEFPITTIYCRLFTNKKQYRIFYIKLYTLLFSIRKIYIYQINIHNYDIQFNSIYIHVKLNFFFFKHENLVSIFFTYKSSTVYTYVIQA